MQHFFICVILIKRPKPNDRMRTLFALLTVFLFTATAVGQSTAGSKGPPGTIKGAVEDSAGKPLSSVSVSLLKNTDSSTIKIAITDKSGQDLLTNIPNGKYLLSFTHIYRFRETTGGQPRRRNGGANDEQSRVGSGGGNN